MQNLAHKWHEMNVESIIGGKTSDNVSLLKLFLIDYKLEFFVETVNAACQKCIVSYHKEFIKKYRKMENKSQYLLHKKREGLQLEFGGSLLITNENITDRYAEKLIKRFKDLNKDFKLEDLFEVYPTEIKEVKETTQIKNKKTTK
ncbi:hypothetical protein [Flavobacterium sp.]|jgi:hypothetical protein|uniref:hypothetical protein n=1 Tax=Flavobacterium sp. TaxID=239 RepID=UPI0037BE68AB